MYTIGYLRYVIQPARYVEKCMWFVSRYIYGVEADVKLVLLQNI
jgi:hypothetical protein